MHVDLPKPLHGWRVFFGEVGVVFLGVLIALGAQQVVDDMNERAEAREARQSIQHELATYMSRLESRWGVRDCITRRLDEIQTLFDGAAEGGPIDTPNWVGRPQTWTLLTSRWDASSQSGRAALLPADELAHYGLMYAYMKNAYDEMIIEQGDWARLRTLEHLHNVTPQMVFELNRDLQDARYRHWRVNGQIADLRRLARRATLPTFVNDVPGGGTKAACIPMTMPRERAARLANPAGEP